MSFPNRKQQMPSMRSICIFIYTIFFLSSNSAATAEDITIPQKSSDRGTFSRICSLELEAIQHIGQVADTGEFVLIDNYNNNYDYEKEMEDDGSLRHRQLRGQRQQHSSMPNFEEIMSRNLEVTSNNSNVTYSNVYRVRRCPCVQTTNTNSNNTTLNHYCQLQHNTCGIPSYTTTAYIGCFTQSTKTIFIRNAWPVLILWYGALLIFLIFTQHGKHARQYMLLKCCCWRQNNDVMVDSIFHREMEIQNQMRRATMLGQRRLNMMRSVGRYRSRRNLFGDDGGEEEVRGELVLKVTTFKEKKCFGVSKRVDSVEGKEGGLSIALEEVDEENVDSGDGGTPDTAIMSFFSDDDDDEEQYDNFEDEEENFQSNSDHDASSRLGDDGECDEDVQINRDTDDTSATNDGNNTTSSPTIQVQLCADDSMERGNDDFDNNNNSNDETQEEETEQVKNQPNGAFATTPKKSTDNFIKEEVDDDDEITCTICLNPIEDGDKVGQIPCKHIFHVSCLKTWIKRRNVCPLCQVPDIASPKRQQNDGDARCRHIDDNEEDDEVEETENDNGDDEEGTRNAGGTETQVSESSSRRRGRPLRVTTRRRQILTSPGTRRSVQSHLFPIGSSAFHSHQQQRSLLEMTRSNTTSPTTSSPRRQRQRQTPRSSPRSSAVTAASPPASLQQSSLLSEANGRPRRRMMPSTNTTTTSSNRQNRDRGDTNNTRTTVLAGDAASAAHHRRRRVRTVLTDPSTSLRVYVGAAENTNRGVGHVVSSPSRAGRNDDGDTNNDGDSEGRVEEEAATEEEEARMETMGNNDGNV